MTRRDRRRSSSTRVDARLDPARARDGDARARRTRRRTATSPSAERPAHLRVAPKVSRACAAAPAARPARGVRRRGDLGRVDVPARRVPRVRGAVGVPARQARHASSRPSSGSTSSCATRSRALVVRRSDRAAPRTASDMVRSPNADGAARAGRRRVRLERRACPPCRLHPRTPLRPQDRKAARAAQRPPARTPPRRASPGGPRRPAPTAGRASRAAPRRCAACSSCSCSARSRSGWRSSRC